jgi:copper chaperone CopZ
MTEKRTAVMPGLVLLAVVAFGAAAAAILVKGNQSDFSANAKDAAKTTVVRIPIQGMTCAVCAANVKKTLQSIKGVQEAAIDLERREARVRYREGEVSPERLVDAINRLGYKAGTPVPEVQR